MSTNIVLKFDKEMTDPVGKHGEFSAAKEGVGDYQTWENYPNSPVLTTNLPYQSVFEVSTATYLYLSSSPCHMEANNTRLYSVGTLTRYTLNGGTWDSATTVTFGLGTSLYTFKEANNDIYTDDTLTSVYFAKTTTDTTALTLTAIALDTDTTKYNLTVSETVLSTDTVTVSYTKGTVTSAYGVSLESFTDFSVRNIV